ncbi:MAG: aspartate kinase, partial [Clostridia bacterium]|nr:aspartate kinase [Clostridia bacterium]
GIAGKVGFSIISIEKDMMNSELGFGRRVLAVLEENSVNFEHLPSSIDSMCVIVKTEEIAGKREGIMNEIFRLTNPDSVQIEDGLALLAVVGRGMVRSKGTAARIFASLANASINIRMIDQGSSELNIIIGIDESDYIPALRAIYNEFN